MNNFYYEDDSEIGNKIITKLYNSIKKIDNGRMYEIAEISLSESLFT